MDRYEEALERARAGKPIDEVFPELKESKDERMWKRILRIVEEYSAKFQQDNVDLYDWLARKSEQKEQKSLPKEYADAFDEFMDHIPENDPESSTSLYTYEDMEAAIQFGIKWQKEQKPVLSSEEKEYIRQLKGLISDFVRDKNPKDVEFYQKIWNWLDGVCSEQKPAKWSEDDEVIVNIRKN